MYTLIPPLAKADHVCTAKFPQPPAGKGQNRGLLRSAGTSCRPRAGAIGEMDGLAAVRPSAHAAARPRERRAGPAPPSHSGVLTPARSRVVRDRSETHLGGGAFSARASALLPTDRDGDVQADTSERPRRPSSGRLTASQTACPSGCALGKSLKQELPACLCSKCRHLIQPPFNK